MRQGFGEDRAGGSSRDLADAAVFLRFAIGEDFELIRLEPLLFRETSDGCGRRGLCRTPDSLFGIGLLRDDAFGANNQAARGGIGADGRVAQLVLFQQVADGAAEILQSAGQHPVGDFFGADFEEEIHAACSWRGPHASATPTACFRMRPITPTRSVTLIAPRASSVLKRLLHFST